MLKKYRVDIDIKWAKVVVLKSKSKPEAKKKAFEKFLKSLSRNDFRISAEKEFDL